MTEEEMTVREVAKQQDVEFEAWSKTTTRKSQLEMIHGALERLRRDVDELREAQQRQAGAARMEALSRRHERRSVERESEPAMATVGLLSLGAMALMAHAASKDQAAPANVQGTVDENHGTLEPSDATTEPKNSPSEDSTRGGAADAEGPKPDGDLGRPAGTRAPALAQGPSNAAIVSSASRVKRAHQKEGAPSPKSRLLFVGWLASTGLPSIQKR